MGPFCSSRSPIPASCCLLFLVVVVLSSVVSSCVSLLACRLAGPVRFRSIVRFVVSVFVLPARRPSVVLVVPMFVSFARRSIVPASRRASRCVLVG